MHFVRVYTVKGLFFGAEYRIKVFYFVAILNIAVKLARFSGQNNSIKGERGEETFVQDLQISNHSSKGI